MDFTAGIITYNRPGYTQRALESLLEQELLPDQVVVYDESESKDTQEVVEELRDRFESEEVSLDYFHSPGKSGFGRARNTVLEKTESEIICFIDDDVVCEPRWLQGIKKGFESDSGVAAVGGPALETDEDLELLNDIVRTNESRCTVSRYGEIRSDADVWIPEEPIYVDTLQGANMAFRKEALSKIGGFDPGYGGNGYREETDVMVRLGEAGHEIIYHPEAELYHIRADSGGAREQDRSLNYWIGRNHMRFLRKNFDENLLSSLTRLMFTTKGDVPPLWKVLAAVPLNQSINQLWLLKGYCHGLMKEDV